MYFSLTLFVRLIGGVRVDIINVVIKEREIL